MYNKVILIGRWVRDLELKVIANSETVMLKNAIAVERPYQKGKDKESDFIDVIAFGKSAEFISKYSAKGKLVLVEGRIQTGHYEKDGRRVNTFEIKASDLKPIEWASKSDFDPTAPVDDGDIPF